MSIRLFSLTVFAFLFFYRTRVFAKIGFTVRMSHGMSVCIGDHRLYACTSVIRDSLHRHFDGSISFPCAVSFQDVGNHGSRRLPNTSIFLFLFVIPPKFRPAFHLKKLVMQVMHQSCVTTLFSIPCECQILLSLLLPYVLNKFQLSVSDFKYKQAFFFYLRLGFLVRPVNCPCYSQHYSIKTTTLLHPILS